MLYIASPYSHPSPAVRAARFRAVAVYTAERIAAGVAAFSPICHSHPIAELAALRGDFVYWQRWCLALLRRADAVELLALPGWERSLGVAAEVEMAGVLGLEVRHVEPSAAVLAWLEAAD